MEPASTGLDPRYPIGRFEAPTTVTAEDRARFIDEIEGLPAAVRDALAGFTAAQIDTPYRDGGWTARQVVHHLADSHMNSFARFKLALTEDSPVIKPYHEPAWALTADSLRVPAETSLALLEALHQRWTVLLRSMGDAEYARTFQHPERGLIRLDSNLALYAWHGRHHTAHIMGLRRRMLA